MSIPDKDRERLRQFFGAYFHQDWALDGPTWQDVVRAYLRDASREDALALLGTMRSWLGDAASDVAVTRDLWDSFGCEYDPQSDGLSDREWVERIAALLATHVER
jgi:contact-dependent growth inhibition (CDI) system CdiI-like immunity protein